jgi:hypothetical protein
MPAASESVLYMTLTLLPECASATATALSFGVLLLVYKVNLSRDTEQLLLNDAVDTVDTTAWIVEK